MGIWSLWVIVSVKSPGLLKWAGSVRSCNQEVAPYKTKKDAHRVVLDEPTVLLVLSNTVERPGSWDLRDPKAVMSQWNEPGLE